MISTQSSLDKKICLKGFRLMAEAKSMTEFYEANFKLVSKYVHATSRGHEAVQLALGMQLTPKDYLSAYYRDDSILLGIGMKPHQLMMQLLAKRDDPFSGGRTYYSHPSLRDDDKPKIPHQSSATGMQAIPSAGVAMGIQYKEKMGIAEEEGAVAVCSLGDACVTEGEVSEAFQMAALKQLPILFLVQDNGWDISAKAEEIRAMDAYDYIAGFPGIERVKIDGTDFISCYETIEHVLHKIRIERRPFLIHASVPLLNHHTSGVRMEWYRDDLEEERKKDPFPKLTHQLLHLGFKQKKLENIIKEAQDYIASEFEIARNADDPKPEDLFTHEFAPTSIKEERGERCPKDKEPTVMVDSALFALKEMLSSDKTCLFYGQDVGGRLGGVFREAATLAQTYGDDRVFNTPIQEAFIVGSTVGMSAVGLKPIVEVQFADYIWPGLNQLFTEVSRSCYLTNGKWPVNMILRVPIGAYGSGGPYHSSSVESVLTNIKGIKVVYPSTGADLKGLMKAAYHDPNPVVILEHKGLYWSKVPGTEGAKTIEPSEDYVIPIGKSRMVQEVPVQEKTTCTIITYGRGVYWAKEATARFENRVEIIDLRSLYPLDEEAIYNSVKKHHRAIVLTEEPVLNSFAQALSARIQGACFQSLDAPVKCIGSENMPAIPLNETLEKTMIPNAEKVAAAIDLILKY